MPHFTDRSRPEHPLRGLACALAAAALALGGCASSASRREPFPSASFERDDRPAEAEDEGEDFLDELGTAITDIAGGAFEVLLVTAVIVGETMASQAETAAPATASPARAANGGDRFQHHLTEAATGLAAIARLLSER